MSGVGGVVGGDRWPLVRPRLDAAAAQARVAQHAPRHGVEAEQRLLYPYEQTRWRLTARLWRWQRSVEALCLVDARTGQASTSDALVVDAVAGGEGLRLAPTREPPELLARAREYVIHAGRHHTRILAAPECELLARSPLWWPFWLVGCRGPRGDGFRVLVDAVRGGFDVVGLDANPTRAPARGEGRRAS